ncbi:MAG: hypothetical protein ACTSUZ_01470 [Candidatus Thorarchaeota archaeon]
MGIDYYNGVKLDLVDTIKSVILFIAGSICFMIQLIISAVIFDDYAGAMFSGLFAFTMMVGAIFAWKKVMSPLFREVYSYQSGPNTRTTVSEDTGQRVQCTPCWGITSGIGAIIAIVMLGGDLVGTPLFTLLFPGIFGGIIGILAAIMFFIEYKGVYYKKVF